MRSLSTYFSMKKMLFEILTFIRESLSGAGVLGVDEDEVTVGVDGAGWRVASFGAQRGVPSSKRLEGSSRLS